MTHTKEPRIQKWALIFRGKKQLNSVLFARPFVDAWLVSL